ncbi:MAG: hypothetical protein AB1426_09160 [Bacillota bacterium]
MAVTLLFFLVVLILVALSTMEKTRQLSAQAKIPNGASRTSPLGSALAYLVGVAGGIYLSLSLVVDFLELKVPARVSFWGMELEPLAALAIALALLQPFLLRLYQCIRRHNGISAR